MQRLKTVLGIVIGVVIICTDSYGTVFYVSPSGSGTGCSAAAPCGFQTALTAAQANNENDTINVTSPSGASYVVNTTLTYTTSNGDNGHSLAIVAPNGQPILAGNGAGPLLTVNTASGSDDAGGHVSVKGLHFNSGFCASCNGAGISVVTFNANVTLTACEFSANVAQEDLLLGGNGGGAYIETDYGDLTVERNSFKNNTAATSGGGLFLRSSGKITLTDNIFTSNAVSSSASSGGGGALWSPTGTAVISGNTFTGNSAVNAGSAGGLFYSGENGSSLVLENNIFQDNSASFKGGGVQMRAGDTSVIGRNNTFSNNSAEQGGGIWLVFSSIGFKDGTVTLTNNSFLGNSSLKGGAIYGESPQADHTSFDLYNTILWQNTAAAGQNGDDLYLDTAGGKVSLFNNDFSGNADFSTGQSEDLFISNTAQYSHGSNIQRDPLFTDNLTPDLHLEKTSPCINAGLNAAPSLPDKDLDGQNRIMNGIVDIGAYERSRFSWNLFLPAIINSTTP